MSILLLTRLRCFMEEIKFKQRAFWTEWAARYGDELASVHRYGDIKELEKIVINIIDKLEMKKDNSVLDAGCGSGVFSSILYKLTDANLIGMDFSIKHLEIMREKYPYIETVNGDVTALPFKNETFDKVVCYSVLQFVKPWRDAVAEIIRVTKRGGKVLLGDIPDRSKRWVLFLISIKKAFMLSFRPIELMKKIRYATIGPEWQWFNIKDMISFIEKFHCKANIIKQPINSQWGTESYRYRIDILIDK